MKDLNGHYCLANKLHYDKLIEEGYDDCTIDDLSYYYILHNRITSYNVDDIDHTKTMHLHDNEWQVGSLEHEKYVVLSKETKNLKGHEIIIHHLGLEPNPTAHATSETPLEGLSLDELKKITAKHEKVAADKYRKDKPVGRITREEALSRLDNLLDSSYSTYYKIQELIIEIIDQGRE